MSLVDTQAPPVDLNAAQAQVPQCVDELSTLVATTAARKLAVYPTGGQTALDYGGPPTKPGVVVDLRALSRIVDYPAADMTITVEAGMTLQQLQSALAAQGQRLTLDPPQAAEATLGGVFATNWGGPRRFGYGRPRDQIIGIRFVNSAGQLIRGGGQVVKNVAGYDFPKLMTGALGTLGIITELTLKVRPLPESTAVCWLAFSNLDSALDAVARLNKSDTRPVAIELLNQLALEELNEFDVSLSGSAWMLAVGFEGSYAAVAWQLDALGRELGEPAIVVRDDEAGSGWATLVELRAQKRWRLVLQVNLPPSRLPQWLGQISPRDWVLQAHAGTAAITLCGPTGAEVLSIEALTSLRSHAQQLGGTLSVVRWPVELDPRIDRFGARPGSDKWSGAIKRAFDPHDLLNPGRMRH